MRSSWSASPTTRTSAAPRSRARCGPRAPSTTTGSSSPASASRSSRSAGPRLSWTEPPERNPVAALIVFAVLALFLLFVAAKTIRIIPQAKAGVVERLGRYNRTLSPGLNIVVPFVDRVKPLIDLREQVVSFQPQPVITEDNVTAHIDTVLHFT